MNCGLVRVGCVAALVLTCSCAKDPTIIEGWQQTPTVTQGGEGTQATDGTEMPGGTEGGTGAEGSAGGGDSFAMNPSATGAQPDGAAEPLPGDPSAWVFDEGALRTYSLSLDPVVWANLQVTARDEVYVLADLEVDGERLPQVGLRFKGGYGTLYPCFDETGALVCAKLSMKIKLDQLDPEQRLHGLKRLNFNSMRTDPSQMHERLGYRLFREMGVPAPRATHARLVVNGEYRGVFSLVEEIDGRFTKSRFVPGDGNLYKEQWPSTADLAVLTEHLETNEGAADHSGMLAFYAALRAATPEQLPQVLEQYANVDQLIDYLTVDRAINSWDGMTGFYCIGPSCENFNYYLYQHDAQARFTLMPWDLDNTFAVSTHFDGVPSSLVIPADCSVRYAVAPDVLVQAPACDPLIGGVARADRARHTAALTRLLDGPFSLDRMNAWLDAWQAQIEPASAEDTHGPGLEAFRAGVARLRGDLAVLRLRAIAERDLQPIERFAIAPGAVNNFESTSELALGLGVSRSATPETTFVVALQQIGALGGQRDMRMAFEFRDGPGPWSQWAQLRVPFAAVTDLRQRSSLRLLLRSDGPRLLRISLATGSNADTDLSGTASWDVQLDGSLQRVDLTFASATLPGASAAVPETLNDVLAGVTMLSFEPAAGGRGEAGYLGAGVIDAGSIQVDEIQFSP